MTEENHCYKIQLLNKILENNAPNKLKWKYSDELRKKHNTIFRVRNVFFMDIE